MRVSDPLIGYLLCALLVFSNRPYFLNNWGFESAYFFSLAPIQLLTGVWEGPSKMGHEKL